MSSILTKEQIIENVVKNHGYKKADVEDVFNASIDYLHHLVKNKCISIGLPYIGNLYFYNGARVMCQKQVRSRIRRGVKVSDALNNKLEYFNSLYDVLNEKTCKLIADGKIKYGADLSHFKIPQRYSWYWRCKEKTAEIEKIQNSQ